MSQRLNILETKYTVTLVHFINSKSQFSSRGVPPTCHRCGGPLLAPACRLLIYAAKKILAVGEGRFSDHLCSKEVSPVSNWKMFHHLLRSPTTKLP